VCSGAVGWSLKHQLFATLSSTEAEYMTTIKVGKEIKWIRNILMEFGYSPSYASTLLIDNKSKKAIQDSLITPVYILSCQNVISHTI